MNSIISRVGCAVALLAVFPALAAPPAPQAPLDPSRIATHLEKELKAAHQAIEKHGARLEGLVGPSLRGDALATEARVLQAELPDLIRDNPHLFEELLGTLRTLEQQSPGELQKQGPGLSKLLNEQLLQGIHRFGQRVGAPPALIVSGGVSLGSYQAGFLYYYTLFLHDRASVLRAIPPANRDSLRSLGIELPDDRPAASPSSPARRRAR
ncbi:hypothetical protein [Archangium sp.]|uniref:hypothetical protein n=1 Tax=Archangium sp. TaxID=1872627 RepID=UPI002D6EF938|nr:hypothetical protein [Archangium sp.]HYO60258.1 hypothetical protein [Archangium sp.]